ncbi:MAG TPA: hypothetical protein VGP46_09645 [Acidimicrobiales bacterium]|jgi:hypothetical protein|nr:hypothetical protein [Acidimicrobiales bacterium]
MGTTSDEHSNCPSQDRQASLFTGGSTTLDVVVVFAVDVVGAELPVVDVAAVPDACVQAAVIKATASSVAPAG